jgi:hypothetical protein
MQKIATRVFICASIAFGVLGLTMVMIGPEADDKATGFGLVVMKLYMSTVFIILPSFALSVAGKYLNTKS